MGVEVRKRGFVRADERIDAHAEIVAFRYPDAGINSRRSLASRGDGGQQARRTRETTYKASDHCAGRAGSVRLNLW
jgi:hypothetical protein